MMNMTPVSVLVPGAGRPYVDGDSLDLAQPLVFEVPEVLAAAACARQIARIEALGPEVAPVTTHRGPVMRPDIRNNLRVVVDDEVLARELFETIEHALPPVLCGMRPVGVNERFRCYRYDPSQRFAPHYDGAFVRDAREQSLLTFMVYLNEGFDGGRTDFHHYDVSVVPRTGRALLFQHHLLHEGCVVTRGTKYVLRSDVMYRR